MKLLNFIVLTLTILINACGGTIGQGDNNNNHKSSNVIRNLNASQEAWTGYIQYDYNHKYEQNSPSAVAYDGKIYLAFIDNRPFKYSAGIFTPKSVFLLINDSYGNPIKEVLVYDASQTQLNIGAKYVILKADPYNNLLFIFFQNTKAATYSSLYYAVYDLDGNEIAPPTELFRPKYGTILPIAAFAFLGDVAVTPYGYIILWQVHNSNKRGNYISVVDFDFNIVKTIEFSAEYLFSLKNLALENGIIACNANGLCLITYRATDDFFLNNRNVYGIFFDALSQEVIGDVFRINDLSKYQSTYVSNICTIGGGDYILVAYVSNIENHTLFGSNLSYRIFDQTGTLIDKGYVPLENTQHTGDKAPSNMHCGYFDGEAFHLVWNQPYMLKIMIGYSKIVPYEKPVSKFVLKNTTGTAPGLHALSILPVADFSGLSIVYWAWHPHIYKAIINTSF